MHPVDLQTTALAIISRNQQCHSSAAACSFSREQNTVSTCRALTSPASPACPNPHSVLRHHSPAALLSRYLLTRFRALALFGRRPGGRVVSFRPRAAHKPTKEGCDEMPRNHAQEGLSAIAAKRRHYSICSSAINNRLKGTSMSSARAVVRLMLRVNLVGNWIDRLPTGVPRKMRST